MTCKFFYFSLFFNSSSEKTLEMAKTKKSQGKLARYVNTLEAMEKFRRHYGVPDDVHLAYRFWEDALTGEPGDLFWLLLSFWFLLLSRATGRVLAFMNHHCTSFMPFRLLGFGWWMWPFGRKLINADLRFRGWLHYISWLLVCCSGFYFLPAFLFSLLSLL